VRLGVLALNDQQVSLFNSLIAGAAARILISVRMDSMTVRLAGSRTCVQRHLGRFRVADAKYERVSGSALRRTS
jgi:hypothetical protein